MYTVFAPTDRAFSVVDTEDLDGLLSDRDMSRALVLRHTITGTLYSAGMRFYQLRDSMEKGSAVTLHKTNGNIDLLITISMACRPRWFRGRVLAPRSKVRGFKPG